jgi:hypothetical protein
MFFLLINVSKLLIKVYIEFKADKNVLVLTRPQIYLYQGFTFRLVIILSKLFILVPQLRIYVKRISKGYNLHITNCPSINLIWIRDKRRYMI